MFVWQRFRVFWHDDDAECPDAPAFYAAVADERDADWERATNNRGWTTSSFTRAPTDNHSEQFTYADTNHTIEAWSKQKCFFRLQAIYPRLDKAQSELMSHWSFTLKIWAVFYTRNNIQAAQ